MDKFTKSVSQIVPCREDIIKELYSYLGNPDECFPDSLFLLGHTGTGKTFLTNTFLQQLNYKFAVVNCIECYTSKILFESLLNSLSGHQLSLEDGFAPYTKCDSVDDFLTGLKSIVKDDFDQNITVPYIIVLDKAERLRQMDHNILPAFLRLRELTDGLNICSILLSDILFEKFYNKTGLSEPIVINIPQYTKDQLLQILMLDFPHSKIILNRFIKKSQSSEKTMNIEDLGEEFYMNFLNVFLNVFFRACRDLPELRHMARSCYALYCEPVLSGLIQKTDVSRLWRNIAPVLKNALGTVYLRVGDQANNSDSNVQEISQAAKLEEVDGSAKSLIHNVELPYYAKYLLISAYLASYNPVKEDKRLFMKHHGKQRKRVQTINARAKVSEKMNTQLGPKVFTLDRLLAIFYAILEERVGLTCNLLAQISSLVQLQLLVSVGGECSIDAAKYQCAVGLDFIQGVAKTVGFNVRKYLFDFM